MGMHPHEWRPPQWHSDFGDPVQEVEMLRTFSIEAIRACPSVTVSMAAPEEGYVYVDILSGNNKVAELHVVEGELGLRYGLFTFDGERETGEYYFVNVRDGIRQLLTSVINEE